jgi:hypothetical protein
MHNTKWLSGSTLRARLERYEAIGLTAGAIWRHYTTLPAVLDDAFWNPSGAAR